MHRYRGHGKDAAAERNHDQRRISWKGTTAIYYPDRRTARFRYADTPGMRLTIKRFAIPLAAATGEIQRSTLLSNATCHERYVQTRVVHRTAPSKATVSLVISPSRVKFNHDGGGCKILKKNRTFLAGPPYKHESLSWSK